MMPRSELPDLLHLGDLGFTVPAAVAIAAALCAGRAGRAALHWCLLFGAGMLAVGANKIAFMAWGAGIDGFAFKAASGHAAGASAVLPLLLYLAAQFLRALRRLPAAAALPGAPRCGRLPRRLVCAAPHIRYASLAAGLTLGAAVALQLVLRCEHTVAEALAGCAVGALVSWGAIGATGTIAPACLRPHGATLWRALLCFGATFVLAAWLMNSLHVAGWMVRAARLLAAGQPLHDLAID